MQITTRLYFCAWLQLWLGLIGLWMLGGIVVAQQPYSYELDENSGLPSQTVYKVIQDQKGYLWFATENGLARYNGNVCRVYNNRNQRGLAIDEPLEGPDGRIWCRNFVGQFFYWLNDSLHETPPFPGRTDIGYLPMTIGMDGTLWVAGIEGVYSIQPQAMKWRLYPIHTTNPQGQLDQPGKLYRHICFSSQKGPLYYFSSHNLATLQDGKFIAQTLSIPVESEFNILRAHDRMVLCEHLGTSIWIIPWEGKQTEWIDLKQRTGRELGKVNGLVQEGNYYWLLTRNGAYKMDHQFYLVEDQPPLLLNEEVTDLKIDREGVYWFSTTTRGVVAIPNPLLVNWTLGNPTYPSSPIGSLEPLGPNQFVAGCVDGSYLLVDANGKVQFKGSLPARKNIAQIRYNPVQKELSLFSIGTYRMKVFDNPTQTGSYQLGAISSYHPSYSCVPHTGQENRSGLLAIGNWGFIRVIVNGGALTPPPALAAWNAPGYSAPEQLEPGIWAVTLRNRRTRSTLWRGGNNELWVGQDDSLRVFTPQGYRTIGDEATGKAIIALHLYEAQDGTIWVGTFGQGLLAIRNNQVVYRFGQPQGLLSPTVNCLLQAGNTLWIGTGRGVHRMNLQTLKLEALSQADGIDLVEVKAMVLTGRWLWAATPKGLFRIPAKQNYRNRTRPLLYLTGIFVNDQRVPLSGTLQLGPLNKNLKLELTGLALRSRGNFSVHYRLLGADTNWNVVPGLQASVSFLSLPAGSYTFQAYAENEDGVVSEAPLQLAFVIQPPFYAAPWFIVLMGLLVAGAVALVTRYRIKLVERKERLRRERAELEQELRISRLSAIKAQMNPHFIFNALNSIQSFFLANDRNAANEYLGKFATLMRKTLQMSAETSVTLDEEIEALTLYMELEQARFQDTLTYAISVDPRLDTAAIRVPSLFIQPYVENAYKHGLLHRKADRKLEVDFRANPEQTHLLVSIHDNGVGRVYTQAIRKNAAGTHRSFATSANQKRIELLNSNRPGSVTIFYNDHISSDGTALGTTVILKLHLQWMQANGKDNNPDSR